MILHPGFLLPSDKHHTPYSPHSYIPYSFQTLANKDSLLNGMPDTYFDSWLNNCVSPNMEFVPLRLLFQQYLIPAYPIAHLYDSSELYQPEKINAV
jgi:hypothetical protein